MRDGKAQLDGRRRIVRKHLSFEKNPYGAGWMLRIRPLPRGAGYRALDYPWHAMSIYAPWWRTRAWFSYVPGFTIVVAHCVKASAWRGDPRPRKRYLIEVRSNGNPRWFPGWW